VSTRPMFRVVEREYIAWRRLWRGSVFQSIVTPLLFLAAMGLGLGGLVDKHHHGGVSGITYLAFVAPGLLAATAMMQGASDSLWPVMAGVKWERTFQAAVATPLRATDVFSGRLTWICARCAFSSSVFLLVAALLGGVESVWGVLAIPAAVLGASVFAAWLSGFSVLQKSDQPFTLIYRMGIFPLFLFSGTFFPTSQLPDWLQPISWLSPLWHAVELCRAATTGSSSSAGSVIGHIAFLVAALVAGCWWARGRFERALTR
jgi:lipooligosaccharide transport system permease protein